MLKFNDVLKRYNWLTDRMELPQGFRWVRLHEIVRAKHMWLYPDGSSFPTGNASVNKMLYDYISREFDSVEEWASLPMRRIDEEEENEDPVLMPYSQWTINVNAPTFNDLIAPMKRTIPKNKFHSEPLPLP